MKVASLVASSIKDVLFSNSTSRCQFEAMMKFDFKIGSPRQNLMQLCFSSLASWRLVFFLLFLALDPFSTFWSLGSSLQYFFGESSQLRFFLLDGQVFSMVLIAVIFFVLEWIVSSESLLIIFIFYFLSQGQLHLNLAAAMVAGVYLSRACSAWVLFFLLESETRRIWKWITSLQVFTFVAISIASLFGLDYLQKIQFLSVPLLRFYFLFSIVILFQFANFLILSIWGHFYSRRIVEPSFLPIYFSTSRWIGKSVITLKMKNELKIKSLEIIESHLIALQKLEEFKDQSPGLKFDFIEDVFRRELAYLETAASRLTIG